MQSYSGASLRRCAHLATKRSALAVIPGTVSRLAAGPHLATEASWPARNALHSLEASLRSSPASAAGFSLLEVLVAFVILALVGTALFQLFGGALNNASAADEYSRAALFAESRLTAAAVETRIARSAPPLTPPSPARRACGQSRSADGKHTRAAAAIQQAATPVQGRRVGQDGFETCPSGNRGASRCAACTASAVFPTPAIPPIA